MARSTFSLSTAVDGSSDGRAIVPRHSKSVRVARRATAPAGARYVVRADVSQFYPSVYTHALDWAFTSRALAKLASKNKSITGPGRRVDDLVAWNTDTDGNPDGPHTSFALGELVMSRVDDDLRKGLPPLLRAIVRGTRLTTTMSFSLQTNPGRRGWPQNFGKRARWLGIDTQPLQVHIDRLPGQLDEEWIAALRQINVPTDNASSQRAALFSLFSEAFRLRGLFPDDNVLAYAIGQFVAANFIERRAVFKENWPEFEGLLLQCAAAEPATLPRVTHLLAWYDGATIPWIGQPSGERSSR